MASTNQTAAEIRAAEARGAAMTAQARRSMLPTSTETPAAKAQREGYEAGRAEGRKHGATVERARVKAILNSDEAMKRPAAAMAAALQTDLTPEAAAAFLAKLPEDSAGGSRFPFDQPPIAGSDRACKQRRTSHSGRVRPTAIRASRVRKRLPMPFSARTNLEGARQWPVMSNS